MSIQNDFDNAAEQWLIKYRYTPDTQVLAKIAQRVQALLEQNGGYVSVAHFERAYLSLLNEGIIRPFRSPLNTHTAAPLIPEEIVAYIESPRISAFEQRKRYSTDPTFKKYYDAYANQKLKEQIAQESSGSTLTVEEYRLLPAASVAQRYHREKGFRAAVDKLIAERKI